MLKVIVSSAADKELGHIPREYRNAILDQIKELEQINHPLQHRRVIKLRGRKTKDFRLRVGDYRIEFTLREPNTILLTRVKHRQVGY